MDGHSIDKHESPRSSDRGLFLYVTNSKTKTGFLLIEVFRKLFNTQNYGHQGSILGGLLIWWVHSDLRLRKRQNTNFAPHLLT